MRGERAARRQQGRHMTDACRAPAPVHSTKQSMCMFQLQTRALYPFSPCMLLQDRQRLLRRGNARLAAASGCAGRAAAAAAAGRCWDAAARHPCRQHCAAAAAPAGGMVEGNSM